MDLTDLRTRHDRLVEAGRSQLRSVIDRASGTPSGFDAHHLLDQARRRSLLEDFGRGEFREGFDLLLDALNETNLDDRARKAAEREIIRRLVARLNIRDWVKKNPTLTDETIQEPLIITGTDPGGIELLARVLACDVTNRAPQRWEAAGVAPPPSIDERGHDPRISRFEGANPTDPASCSALLAIDFADALPFRGLGAGYHDWWSATDHSAAYDYHRLQLQILQSAWPTMRWVLHSASHLWHLDAVLRSYPDARVVWVHRDPAHVVQQLVPRRADPRGGAAPDLGKILLSGSSVARRLVERLPLALEARSRHPETSFFDLQFVELVDDPVGAVERFYRDWNLELGELSRWRMQALLSVDGVLPSPVEPSRADIDSLRDQLAEYVHRFEIPSEASSI